jgi:hypothetical protein
MSTPNDDLAVNLGTMSSRTSSSSVIRSSSSSRTKAFVIGDDAPRSGGSKNLWGLSSKQSCFIGVALTASALMAMAWLFPGSKNTLFANEVVSFKANKAGGAEIKNEDGCGLHGESPKWVPYTPIEYKILEMVSECNPVTYPQHPPWLLANITALQCSTNVGLDLIPSIIGQFDRVWFIGDSVLKQQYWSLICMLSLTTVEDIIGNVQAKFDNNITYLKDGYEFNATLNGTFIRYTQFGWKFDTTEKALYETDFPEAVRTYTEKDAIVINAGAHYDGTRTTLLKNAANFINNMSHHSKANIFYVETSDEQWPTSNGMYTEACTWKCQCEHLTPERILGYGDTYDRSEKHINMSLDPSNTGPFDGIDFDRNQTLHHHSLCIPDCLPASWRSDLANPILERNASSKFHLVPVCRQLVERRLVSSKSLGDCIHKTSDALIAMNQQLCRSMLHALSQRF